jgi:hypothetical protein
MMAPTLLSLPIEIRLQIWHHIFAPTEITACECLTVTPDEKKCTNDTTDIHCMVIRRVSERARSDVGLLRVCKAINQELKPIVQLRTVELTICAPFCFRWLVEGSGITERRMIRAVRMRVHTCSKDEDLKTVKAADQITSGKPHTHHIVSALEHHGMGVVKDVRWIPDTAVEACVRCSDQFAWIDITLGLT